MVSSCSATAIAHPNIALIKYWGNRDDAIHIPANSSISMNLGDLSTRTQVILDSDLENDQLILNNSPANDAAQLRVQQFLDYFRAKSGKKAYCRVISSNNFPTAAGIASSASAFAALTLAAAKVYQLELDQRELSRIARLGSGSACRSIPPGFVYWQAGNDHQSSYAESFAPPEYWDLVDCIAVIGDTPKTTSSIEGHRLAATSPLQKARIETAECRLNQCRNAILERNFSELAKVVELDTNLMHVVMITSQTPLLYWQPPTIAVMQQVLNWRSEKLSVFYTIDAGASVHVICLQKDSEEVIKKLKLIEGVRMVIPSGVGGAAHLVES